MLKMNTMNQEIINDISSKNRVLGQICYEADRSYESENYFTALSCLFIATEHALKTKMGVPDGHFNSLIEDAKKQNLISDIEYFFIRELKNIRNKLFHEDHFSSFWEIDSLICPAYEDDTKQILYEKFSNDSFVFVKGCL